MAKEKKFRILFNKKFVKKKATRNTTRIDGHLTESKRCAEIFDTSKEANIKAGKVSMEYGTPRILFQVEEFFRRKY